MKRMISVLLILVMLAACLAGCTNESNDAGADAPAVFRYGLRNSWPDAKNPYASSWAISTTVYHANHYEGLLRVNPELEQEGRLATEWELSDDGLTWTIKLRQGVKWSDGEDFTADDVVFSYRAVLDNELPRWFSEIRDITNVEKTDSHTVSMTTSRPRADYINMFMLEIVPEHIWNVNKTQEDFLTFFDPELVGTGPFVFVDESVDEFVRYKANDSYWGGRPKIDELVYVFFANDDTKLQALQAGEIDITTVTSAQAEYAGKLDGITLLEHGTLSFTEMGFNMWQSDKSKGNPLIRDVKEIRQAIDYAINYEELIEFAKGGFANMEYGLVPSLVKPFSWTPDENTRRDFSPEKAVELLEKAGFTEIGADGVRENKDGQRLSFRATVIEGSYKDAALLIQRYCKDIGIAIDITFVDSSRQSAIIYDQDFDTDIYFWGWTADYEDPGFILSVMTTEQVEGRSDCFYSNAAYDALFEAQSAIIDIEERIKAVHEMQEIIYEDAPYLILFTNKNVIAYNSAKWTGFVQWPANVGGILSMYSLVNISLR